MVMWMDSRERAERSYGGQQLEEPGTVGPGEVGEIATVPTAAAIANAVCDALDVEHIEMPITSEKAWLALTGAAPAGGELP